jgi:hypothetical protein
MYVRNTKQLPVSWVENEFENHVIESPEVHKDFQHVFKCGVGAAPTRGTITIRLIAFAMDAKKKQSETIMAQNLSFLNVEIILILSIISKTQ